MKSFTISSEDTRAAIDDPGSVIIRHTRYSRDSERRPRSRAPFTLHVECSNSGSTTDSPYHKNIFSSGQRYIFYCNRGMAVGTRHEDRPGQWAWRMSVTWVAALNPGPTRICRLKKSNGKNSVKRKGRFCRTGTVKLRIDQLKLLLVMTPDSLPL